MTSLTPLMVGEVAETRREVLRELRDHLVKIHGDLHSVYTLYQAQLHHDKLHRRRHDHSVHDYGAPSRD